MKIYIILLSFCLILLHACSPSKDGNSNYPDQPEMTAEQKISFEALNTIQVQLVGNHLYSTFANLEHSTCHPPDTSFIITQEEFLDVLENLLIKYGDAVDYQRLKIPVLDAIKAQETYVVNQCYRKELISEDVLKSKESKIATWILPAVLGRRDVIIEF